MIWTDNVIWELRTLWTQGHSTAEIGRRLGCSKNCIVGKAHRLDLEDRLSPIRRPSGSFIPAIPSVPRVVGPTLPPLPSYVPPATPPRPRVVAPPPPPPAPVVFLRPNPQPCCWPIGHPRTKAFRFCDDNALPGRPYCDEHAKLAYVRIRDRREDADVSHTPPTQHQEALT